MMPKPAGAPGGLGRWPEAGQLSMRLHQSLFARNVQVKAALERAADETRQFAAARNRRTGATDQMPCLHIVSRHPPIVT
jgi:hypothetical protein